MTIVILFVCLKVIWLLIVSILIQTYKKSIIFHTAFLKLSLNLTLKNSLRFENHANNVA